MRKRERGSEQEREGESARERCVISEVINNLHIANDALFQLELRDCVGKRGDIKIALEKGDLLVGCTELKNVILNNACMTIS